MKIFINEAIKLLEKSDCIIINFNNSSDPFIATFVGMRDNGNDDQSFVIGGNGVDDIVIENVEWDSENGIMKVSNFNGYFNLYKIMKS